MYTLIDWLLTLISWFLIIFLPIYYEDGYYCLIGIASYLLYPIPMEIIYNCLASWMYTESDIARSHQV
jgi:hypothetical protein